MKSEMYISKKNIKKYVDFLPRIRILDGSTKAALEFDIRI
jgi:hypothetical protein